MHGEVISVDEATGDGVILGEDSQSYPFAAAACRGRLKTGQKVEFTVRDGAAVQVFKLFAARQNFALKAPPVVEEGPDVIDTPVGYVRRGWVQLLWSPDGRITRTDFWKAFGVLMAISVLLTWIPFAGAFINLGVTWGNIAIQTKRLHDMGRTGWLQLIPYAFWLIAVVLAIPTFLANPGGLDGAVGGVIATMAMVPLLLGTLSTIGFLIWVGAAKGQSGPNRFGPDPKSPAETAAEIFA